MIRYVFAVCAILASLAFMITAVEANMTYRMNVTCSDGLCQPGENSYNCPEDCARLPFEFSTNFIEPTILAGKNRSYYILFRNKLDRDIELELETSRSLNRFIQMKEEIGLPALSDKKVNFTVSIPRDNPAQKILGNIVIRYSNHRNSIPVELNTLEYRDILVQMKIDALTTDLNPQDILRFYLEIYSYEENPINLRLRYLIRNIEDNESLFNSTRNIRGIRNSRMLVDEINLSRLSLDEGEYFIEAQTSHNGKEISSSSEFSLTVPFWTPQRIRLFSYAASLAFLLIVAYFSYARYQKWKKERMRYVLPDLDKIPKKGDEMFKVGKIPEVNKLAYLDPQDLTTHCLCAGSTGSGKSVTASILAEEALLKGIPVIAFDPTNQWTGFVKQLKDKRILQYYKQFGLTEADTRSFKGLIYDVKSPDIQLDIRRYMNPGEITVFNLSNLKPGEYDQAVLNIVNRIFAISWPETHDLKAFIVFDECHRLLEKYGGTGGYIALEKACREFRKWGLGLLMISQVSADFKQAVAGNILTEIQLNTKSVEDIQKIAQKYGTEYSSKITRQGIGVAMVQNPKYNEGKPWFVHFRPPLHDPHKISEKELQQYSDYSNRLDEIERTIVAARKKGADVEEIVLEYKLTRSKLKEGHFKMVDMYLKSLDEKLKKLG